MLDADDYNLSVLCYIYLFTQMWNGTFATEGGHWLAYVSSKAYEEHVVDDPVFFRQYLS